MRRAMLVVAVIAGTFVLAPAANADDPIVITVSSEEAVEGPANGTIAVAVTVELSAPAPATVSIVVTPTAGSARAGADFKAKAATARIASGTTSKAVLFTVFGDNRDEIDESFTVDAASPSGAYVVAGPGTITILDDDGTTHLRVLDDIDTESDGRPYTNAHAAFELSAPVEHAVTVTYATVPLDAFGGGSEFCGCGGFVDPAHVASRYDYSGRSGTVTFDRGKTFVQRAVDITSDELPEIDESFLIVILNVSAAPDPYPSVAVDQDVAIVTILDDDDTPQNNRMVIYEGNIDGVPPARVVEILQAAEIDRIALSVQQMTMENAFDYSVLVGAITNVGITVDAYGRDDLWTTNNPAGALDLVEGVIEFNQFSPFDFSGVHLRSEPWHDETVLDYEAAFASMFGTGLVDSALADLAHDNGLTVELSLDPDHAEILTALDGLGVDTVSIHTGTDHASGPDGAIARIADEIALAATFSPPMGVRAVGSLSLEGGPTSSWDETLGQLELEAMALDAAYNPEPPYRGTGVIDFLDLEAKMGQEGVVFPLEEAFNSPGAALYLRDPSYLVDPNTLGDVVTDIGFTDLLMDAEDLGDSPDVDLAYRNLISDAHLHGLRVFATVRDVSVLSVPGAGDAWLADVTTFNSGGDITPVDDFDGVHIAVDTFNTGAVTAPIASALSDAFLLGVADIAADVPPPLLVDVSIPYFVDGSTAPWPSVSEALTLDPNVDIVTLQTLTDDGFEASNRLAPTASYAAVNGRSFRASHLLTPQPDPFTTFFDDGLAYTIYQLNTVEFDYNAAPGWSGNAVDGYAEVVEKITTFPPPPAPPIVTFTNLDIVDEFGVQSPLFVYAGPSTGPGAPPECPVDADFCFVANAPEGPDPMPFIQYDAEAHHIGQPPGSETLQCSLYDGMTLAPGFHACNNSVFFEVIILGFGPGGGGDPIFTPGPPWATGGGGIPTIEWTNVSVASPFPDAVVYIGPADDVGAPPECGGSLNDYCFVITAEAALDTVANWLATSSSHPVPGPSCWHSGAGVPFPFSPGGIMNGSCSVTDPGTGTTFFDYILVRQGAPAPDINVFDVSVLDHNAIEHVNEPDWVFSGPSGPGGIPEEFCPAAEVDFCLGGFTAQGEIHIRFTVTAPPGSTLNPECQTPFDIVVAQNAFGAEPDITCTATGDFNGTKVIRVLYAPTPPAPPGDITPPVITVVGQTITDATEIIHNGPPGGPCPATNETPGGTVPFDWCFITGEGAPGTITFTATAEDDVDGPITVFCTPGSPYFTPPGAFEAGECIAMDIAGNVSHWRFGITNLVPPAPPGAAKVAAGGGHSCAILDNGIVRCWGAGSTGQLGYGDVAQIGDNETPGSVGPVDLGPGRTATTMAGGTAHTCAVLDDGTVRCWGFGGNGRLGYGNIDWVGDNETPGSVGPVDLGPGRTATALTAGNGHTCAILDDAAVRCWGFNGDGELGYGNTADIGDNETPAAAGPVDLGPGRTAAAISAAAYHTCAVLDNGTVVCWGANGFGQLGYGNTTTIGDTETAAAAGPVDLGPGRTAIDIAAGGGHTCAILDDGTVRCWGANGAGQLGYGNTTIIGDTETPAAAGPVDLGPGRTAIDITAGGDHTCAVLDDGTVRCWGYNGHGRLGYGNIDWVGDNETPGSVGPVDLGPGRTATAITALASHTCAILDDGTVRCWGFNGNGQLGYGNTDDIGDNEMPGSVGPVQLV